MIMRKYKPTSPGRRFASVLDFSEITSKKPERSLLEPLSRTGGRNNRGRMTTRRMGGGAKRQYRIIDFKRNKDDVPAKVASIEYDPNRSARIALLHYRDGEKRYIIAPEGLKVGDAIASGEKVEPKIGNAMPLKNIPLGMDIHNVELEIGHGGQLSRSAGSLVRLLAREGGYVHIILPSGEIRKVHEDCRATIGHIGNADHINVVIGKAGRSRHMGIRSHVRGVAMNPVSHPMGGGEGRAHGGRPPCSPTGVLSKGGKTRNKRALSNKFIIRRRQK
ncbi:MAG: 50S ribosomal protein L2 [Planctomycetes bacterium GWA2_50_13]|nr:MAG: 50S ribosomal protein L2 [Planctomycetes bacterium GWA2_50_13]OHB95528.1 MAG: 50S ribosomal protein L2 [Planctomycetes bacterium RIFCSPLOWO2_02_FULL_50_16]HCN19965.1 50S ribosomal protein L2 [Planctomycetia bacterium]